MLRTGVLQDSMAPYPIESCWRVFGELCLPSEEEAGFPSLRVAPTRFSAGVPSKCQRMRVRQAVVFFSLPHLPSLHSLRLFVLCLPHSLGLYIAYFISSLPSKHRCH
jgi:hypothetical protein